MNAKIQNLLTWTNFVWLLVYSGVLVVALTGLRYVRAWSLQELATAQSQADWDQWRSEAARQSSGSGPVKRRVPQSAEPPALVLMRDHFQMIQGALVIFGTVLFGTFMLMIRGTLGTSYSPARDPANN